MRSRIVVVFVMQRIDRYSYCCVYLVPLLCIPGSAQYNLYLIDDRYRFFYFDNPMGRVLRFFGLWAKFWRLGPSNSEIRYFPVELCNVGLHKKTVYFVVSKNVNLKLGLGSHKNQPQDSYYPIEKLYAR